MGNDPRLEKGGSTEAKGGKHCRGLPISRQFCLHIFYNLPAKTRLDNFENLGALFAKFNQEYLNISKSA